MSELVRDIVVGLLTTLLVERASALALLIARLAARCLPTPEARERYRRDWEADLLATDGGLSRLFAALGMVLNAAQMRATAEVQRLSLIQAWVLVSLGLFVVAGVVALFYLVPLLVEMLFLGLLWLVPRQAPNEEQQRIALQEHLLVTTQALQSGWVLLPYVALSIFSAMLIRKLLLKWGRA